MDIVITKTQVQPFRRVLATNSVASSESTTPKADVLAASLPASGLQATTTGLIDLIALSKVAVAPNSLKVKFYGAGSDNTTGECRIYGLAPLCTTGETPNTPVSYTYTLLGFFTFTLSGSTGVSGGVVTDSERYADTVARTFGNANVSDQIFSPAGSSSADYAGHVVIDVKGHEYVLFDLYLGSVNPATSVNALYAPM